MGSDILMAMPANIRVNAQTPFPALVSGVNGVTITKSNGIWMVGLSPGSIQSIIQAMGFSQGQYLGTNTNDSASPGNIGEYRSCLINDTTATVTITIASPAVVTWTAHGLQANSVTTFTTTGALPTGLVAGTPYYVIGSSITTNTFQVATSVANAIAGTAVVTTGTQSGVQTGTNAATLTTATPVSLGGFQLTPGDWDVWGSVSFGGGASTTVNIVQGSISPTTTTLVGPPTGQLKRQWYNANTIYATINVDITLSQIRVSISGNANYFLVAQSTFGVSSSFAYGWLQARRAR